MRFRTHYILLSFLFLSFGYAPTEQNIIDIVKKKDLSDLWTLETFNAEDDTLSIERPEPLGYIGDDYQRFQIHFISVIKNPDNALEYLVYGKSMVHGNVCSFQGTITITEIQTFSDELFPDKKQGILRGTYTFYEDPDQEHVGIFKGKFRTDFYQESNGEIKYNALMFISDLFLNNQFEGTWSNYNGKDIKKCNWGDFRIPDSGKLDVGVGEFGPAEEYEKNGWETYNWSRGMYGTGVKYEQALKAEQTRWWLDQ